MVEKVLKITVNRRFWVRIIVTGAVLVAFAATYLSLYFSLFVPKGFLNMGMNVGENSLWGKQLIFNDAFKTAQNVRQYSDWALNKVPVDKDGYPLEIPYGDKDEKALFCYNNFYEGNYLVRWDGDGDFSFSDDAKVIARRANEIELKLSAVPITSAGKHRFIVFNRSDKNNPVRNIRIIPKKYSKKESKMPRFRQDFLDGLKSMHSLRFMGMQNTNASNQEHFENRSLPTDFSSLSGGVPYEYIIELANTLKADAWICVPHKATDDYILSLAKMLKSGLDKELKIYIEYSNEVWNTNFPQSTYVRGDAPEAFDEYVSQDLSALPSFPQKRAYMMARTFRLFESVFSGNNRKRLITVGGIQTSGTYDTREMTAYFIKNKCVPDAFAATAYFGFETSHWNDGLLPLDKFPRENANELNEYFHNIWNSNPAAVTKDDILDAVESLFDYIVKPSAAETAGLIKATGAKFLIYEGGQHMQPHNQGVFDYNQAVYDSQISPRMYNLYMKNFELHRELDCDMFMNFSYIGERESNYGSWGVLENNSDIYSKNLKSVSPKYKAIIDANIRKGLANYPY